MFVIWLGPYLWWKGWKWKNLIGMPGPGSYTALGTPDRTEPALKAACFVSLRAQECALGQHGYFSIRGLTVESASGLSSPSCRNLSTVWDANQHPPVPWDAAAGCTLERLPFQLEEGMDGETEGKVDGQIDQWLRISLDFHTGGDIHSGTQIQATLERCYRFHMCNTPRHTQAPLYFHMSRWGALKMGSCRFGIAIFNPKDSLSAIETHTGYFQCHCLRTPGTQNWVT